MYVIRPITANDIEAYVQFAFTSTIGISSMPKNREFLQKNIQLSLDSFSKELSQPKNELYLFVVENLETNVIGGISGIISKTGIKDPSYFYRSEIYRPKSYKGLPIPDEMRVLSTVAILNGPTEICSLYLDPEFRREGLGRLLSLARFLFMASYPKRFDDQIVAVMRGFVDKNNTNPFWEHLGRHFLNIQYVELLKMIESGKQFVPHILPQYPIYVDLLPEEARNIIGKVHHSTKPALNMLMLEGFEMTHDYDVFDAGPKIMAKIDSIRTYKQHSVGIIEEITSQHIESDKYILSNCNMDFRACLTNLKIMKPDKVIIPSSVSEGMNLQIGDPVRYILASPSPVYK